MASEQAEIDQLESEIAQLQNQLGDKPGQAMIPTQEQDYETEIKKLEMEIKDIKSKSPVPAQGHKRKIDQVSGTDDVYCICRMGCDGTQAMVECDVCQEWYHSTCIGLLVTEVSCIEYYCCLACQKQRKKNKPIIKFKTDAQMTVDIDKIHTLLAITSEIALVEAELDHLRAQLPPPPTPTPRANRLPATPAAATPKARSTPRASTPRTPAPSRGRTPAASKSLATPKSTGGRKRKSSKTAAPPVVHVQQIQCREPTCRVLLKADAKFCSECGTKVALTCRGCQAIVSPTAKFCSECGLPQ